MKNMRKFMMMIMVVALTALPAMAQVFGQQQKQQFGATMPGAQIQSTSSFSGSGSAYSSNPTLNSDGTAAYHGPSYSPAGSKPRRAGDSGDSDDDDWGTNQEHKDIDPGSPIGSPVLPLLLLACAYIGLRAFLNRKRVE